MNQHVTCNVAIPCGGCSSLVLSLTTQEWKVVVVKLVLNRLLNNVFHLGEDIDYEVGNSFHYTVTYHRRPT